ncbi:MAG: alpha-glucan family phosphorylase [Cytophagaceae bacterium]|jgi:phosphorylase/glycogen(starch) synthase|nr:alpha-glucan family phosphorylase [Cytophagaceae bacterium]
MANELIKPDYLFETSWEVCNKMGGIHTVLASKAETLREEFGDRLIFIGPDVWMGQQRNPEFLPDDTLFPEWAEQLKQQGIRVKCGRWNIPCQPVVVLIDFTTFIADKNKILAYYWETFQVDSISGQWDYIESVLFGYAAGVVVESFCKYYLNNNTKVIAHFNEWMTGSGALYLNNKLLQVGTVFTTHATVTGRSLAGNRIPIYDNLTSFNGDIKAQELHVVAKHSIEKIAANNSDCFTTVSEITAKECVQLLNRNVDEITPNGFESSFVPKGDEYTLKRAEARRKLRKVASALLGYEVGDDAMLIATSGRYEYRNKGIDLFLDSLGAVNEQLKTSGKQIIAFALIPANTSGARKDLIDRLDTGEHEGLLPNSFLTHGLYDIGSDPILNKVQELHLTNTRYECVKLIFVPSYLKGDDGIFNVSYYDLLVGMDLTVFPSYYEPWGYTPLESIAFGIPTVTTTLTGFGLWAMPFSNNINEGISVVLRNDVNDHNVIGGIVHAIIDYASKNDAEKALTREMCFELAEKLEWTQLIEHYHRAYSVALEAVNNRRDKFTMYQKEPETRVIFDNASLPAWKRLIIKSKLPERISVLHELTRNLWWTWNYEATELFESIDEKIWNSVNRNPILLLEKVSYTRLTELSKDTRFVANLDALYNKFKAYMEKPFDKEPSIAYFSMEYGISDVLKIFSGGLGILAGDYLKEASDRGVNIVAVGLLYRYGYFTQTLTVNGEQTAKYEMQEFPNLPVEEVRNADGKPVHVKIELPGRDIHAAVWKARVGRISLYLLDTDIPVNAQHDREITHMLYGGDWENRLKQEILLGVGGIRLLQMLNINTSLYHCNEGHAALINVERLVNLVEQKFTFTEALELVRASSLFTTHTPVPAGHDMFDEGMFRAYTRHIPERLGITWDEFMALGREGSYEDEKFSMSVLAAKTSQEVNGVSWLHGEVTKRMFANLWKGYFPEELHIGYVTNGVHYGTWTASEFRRLYEKEFGEGLLDDVSDKSKWERIYKVSDDIIWDVRKRLKKKLFNYIEMRMQKAMVQRSEDPSHIVDVFENMRPEALTIGFARRFATYKRAHLLFGDLDRLKRIVNNPKCPVQFIFAGKAHPADGAGQGLIKKIVDISKHPDFVGKIIFLENYDMDLAKRLVSGVDVWLNTPTRPLEASGTSGEKAELNGVLNFSVLDGWWYEGYKEGAGWMLTDKRSFDNQNFQDELDASIIYSVLENDIIPTYFDIDSKGVSSRWVKYIKNSLAQIAPEYTTRRMINDYIARFYEPMLKRVTALKANNYASTHKLAAWKQTVVAGWDSITVLDVKMPDIGKNEIGIGEKYQVDIKLNLKELSEVDFGLEMVIAEATDDDYPKIVHIAAFDVVKKDGSVVSYHLNYELNFPGVYKFGLRLFPTNAMLPHKQDFNLVRWL